MGCRYVVFLSVWIVLSAAGGAQSFDCEKAATNVEKAVCADSSLSLADDRLAAAYKQVMSALPPDAKVTIREGEASWLRSLENACAHKPAFQENFTTCLKRMYKERTVTLQKMVVSKGGVKFVMLEKTLLTRDSADDIGNKDIEENPGFGTLHVSWPQALTDAPEWKAWNAEVLAETQKEAGGTGELDQPWKKEWAADSETEVTATVDAISGGIVSTQVSIEGMGHGAAHPGEATHEFHWLLKDGRKLKTSDVFLPRTGWESALERRCRASLKIQIGKDYEEYVGKEFQKTLDEVVLNPENWTMDGTGVTISFPEYSVTPRMDPAEPVTAPWATLKGMLAVGFELPK